MLARASCARAVALRSFPLRSRAPPLQLTTLLRPTGISSGSFVCHSYRHAASKPLAKIDLARQTPTTPAPHSPLLTPEADVLAEESDSYNTPRFFRPILFSACVVGISFGALSYYEADKRWKAESASDPKWSLYGLRNLITRMTGPAPAVPSSSPPYSWIPGHLWDLKVMLHKRWDEAPSEKRLAYGIVTANLVVFLLWRIPLMTLARPPAMTAFMMRHFTHHSLSGRSYTLLTSAFSHMTVLHFAFNMNALLGFVPFLEVPFGSWEHMLAFYLSAGVLASLTSHILSLLWLNRVRKPLSCLGASGALYATIVGCAALVPDMGVNLVFLPGVEFTIFNLVSAMVLVDMIGLIRGWAMLDHAAHLGGAAFGYLYVHNGGIWNQLQDAWDEHGMSLEDLQIPYLSR
ncbi:hypothetical protein BDZ88DRAFT_113281 [Geranomyces variabilis]|nr:hypothetical protein BDZ88DRAFT_113281 [Geranomyces variabilis]KAJ3141271.1 hypothetical protein HDU90_007298 [Geranomyces variabilis]